jgi:hypothetical protein
MHKVSGNYSSFTGRSSENICSNNGGAQAEGKSGQNRMKLSLPPKKMVHFKSALEWIPCSST